MTEMAARPLVDIGMANVASMFLQLEVFPKAEGLRNLGKHHVPDDLRAAAAALTQRIRADWSLGRFRAPFDPRRATSVPAFGGGTAIGRVAARVRLRSCRLRHRLLTAQVCP
jgi:hypothetical protein